MKTTITESRTLTAGGYTAKCNIKFCTYDGVRYYAGVAEVAKVLKSLLKVAGFEVIRATSQSYSGGESIDIKLKSELTEEQKAENAKNRDDVFYGRVWSGIIHQEPRERLTKTFEAIFKSGSFDGMEDIYNYKSQHFTVEAPNGSLVNLDAKYIFIDFER